MQQEFFRFVTHNNILHQITQRLSMTILRRWNVIIPLWLLFHKNSKQLYIFTALFFHKVNNATNRNDEKKMAQEINGT